MEKSTILKTDLHTHSYASDGMDSPEMLVHNAVAAGIRILAITDHDTVDGIDEAIAENLRLGSPLKLIPGIEFSTEWEKTEIHVLGYSIDWRDRDFLETLSRLRIRRDNRNHQIIRLMNEDGIPITMEDLMKQNPDTTITRAHFARYLIDHGIARDRFEAFSEFLGRGKKYYYPKEFITPMEAVRIIRKAGGAAFLAHPGLYHFSRNKLEELIELLRGESLRGIEVYHSSHSITDSALFLSLAWKYQLEISCGSDYHGSNKPDVTLGSVPSITTASFLR